MPSAVAAAAQKGEQSYDMTSGQNGPLTGFDRALSSFGSINPDVLLWDIYKFDRLMDEGTNWLLALLDGVDNDLTFREVEISGTFLGGANTFTLQRSAATFDPVGANGIPQWSWPRPDQILSGAQVYSVIFRR